MVRSWGLLAQHKPTVFHRLLFDPVLSRLVVRSVDPRGCCYLTGGSGSSRGMCGPPSQENKLFRSITSVSGQARWLRKRGICDSATAKRTFSPPLHQGQCIAYKLKGISHPHVVPNGECVAVQWIAPPLVGLETFSFKTLAMPVPSLFMVAAP